HEHPKGRRKSRNRGAQAHYLSEKGNSRRQRGVGRPLSQVLFRRTPPPGHCLRCRRTSESRPPLTRLSPLPHGCLHRVTALRKRPRVPRELVLHASSWFFPPRPLR